MRSSPGPDHVEGEDEDRGHDGNEAGNGRPLAREDAVDLGALLVLLALVGLDHAGVADVEDELEAHVGNGRARIDSALLLHLTDDVGHRLLFVRT